MADNVILDSMSGGETVATDDIGGVQHQLVKLEYGAANSATQVDASNPLPVSAINGTVAIPAGVAVTTPGTITSGSIAVTAGTVQATLASPGTITSGSIAVTAGTIGTVGAVGQVHNAGTVQGGTIGVVSSVSQVVTGTIANSGTTTGVGVVSNLTNGSIVVTAGTVGTVTNVGQVYNAGTIQNGTLAAVTTVANLTNGTVRVTAGTVNSGTINAGTINAGTINAGTIKIQPRTTVNLLTIGSVWGTSSGTAGTIVAAPGASTVMMINELSIVNEGTTNVTAGMGFGTAQQGTTVIVRAALAGNGGIQKSFPLPIGGSHVNLPLVVWTTGSGTASFNLTYWTEAQ